jgi:hypothetical protein
MSLKRKLSLSFSVFSVFFFAQSAAAAIPPLNLCQYHYRTESISLRESHLNNKTTWMDGQELEILLLVNSAGVDLGDPYFRSKNAAVDSWTPPRLIDSGYRDLYLTTVSIARNADETAHQGDISIEIREDDILGFKSLIRSNLAYSPEFDAFRTISSPANTDRSLDLLTDTFWMIKAPGIHYQSAEWRSIPPNTEEERELRSQLRSSKKKISMTLVNVALENIRIRFQIFRSCP